MCDCSQIADTYSETLRPKIQEQLAGGHRWSKVGLREWIIDQTRDTWTKDFDIHTLDMLVEEFMRLQRRYVESQSPGPTRVLYQNIPFDK